MEEMHAGKRSRKEEDEEEGEGGGGGGGMSFLPWQNPASRICRVSRASGGKDRHSKVLTAKGLRDRRVRLSVSTAIQFYDLQDRLGYDQPSKAVEWLIKAASAAIAELPSLDGAFAELSTRLAKRSSTAAPAEDGGNDDNADVPRGDDCGITHDHHNSHQHNNHQHHHHHHHRHHQQQHVSLTRSTCSSNSEMSRGSVLSFSRSESRAKARERAKERCTTGEKGDSRDEDDAVGGPSLQNAGRNNPVSQCSFTDLLNGSGCQDNDMVTIAVQANNNSSSSAVGGRFTYRHTRNSAPVVTTDYFGQESIAQQKPPPHHHVTGVVPASASAQASHYVNGSPVGVMPFNFALSTAAAGGDGEHAEIQQQLPFLQDHLIPVAAVTGGGDYNLNFSISSSGLSGFNRGTLQSNSPSLMTHFHHLQRLSSSQADGSNLPFFFGMPHPPTSVSGENPFPAGFDGRLQMCYGDGYRQSDLKGKGKN